MLPGGASLSEWLDWLETLSPRDVDLGLERVQAMLARLEPAIPAHVLLVAGTNGKGSSVAMCDALLRAAGQRVGAYTSPHLHRFNERISVNGFAAHDADIIAAFERIEACRDELPLTYFEYTTLAAVLLFAAATLDVWILEIGLGGRLDASNAIEPTASLITNISLDHCDWLGDSIEQIAAEKAGVMRAGMTTVFADAHMPATIEREASMLGAQLLRNGRDFEFSIDVDGTWSWRSGSRELTGLQRPGLQGDVQIGNAAAVLALLGAAGFDRALRARLVNKVLPTLTLPGRMQQLLIGGRQWLFDVAHNAASAGVLAAVLEDEARQGGTRKTIVVIGLMKDKDLEGIVEPLRSGVDRWVAVTADSPRALPATEIARRIANHTNTACLAVEDIERALEFARRTSSENDRIVVTGSFLAVGPALQVFGYSQESA